MGTAERWGTSIDTLLAESAISGRVPGVVAIAANRDAMLYEGSAGHRRIGGDAMTLDTVFWIASMTKAVTGAAAMQLVEQGRISLDAAAAQYLPALGRVRVLTGWDDAGRPVTREPKRPITLRHCLTHTAGWGYDLWNEDISKYQQAMNLPATGSGQNLALDTPLLFDPGEQWQYGIGIDWAGKLVESISGLSLGEYFSEHLFRPLGMTDTSFRIRPDMRARKAAVHSRASDDSLAPTEFETQQSPEFESGGGGLYSTAADYLKFAQMILNRGRANQHQILRPETVDLMSRNAMGERRVTTLRSAIPARTNDAEFFPGVEKSWGLTFMINHGRTQTGRTSGSLGWGGLANTYYWIDPKAGVTGVFMTQILPFADKYALPLFYAFESQIYRTL